MARRLNFDANATYGLDPEVGAALAPMLSLCEDELLNPSSLHSGGQAAKRILDSARDGIAKLLALSSEERVIFTSGATEANNLAIATSLPATAGQRNEIVVSAIEHPSVLEPLLALRTRGFTVHEIKPSGTRYVPTDLADAVTERTAVLSMMVANNETGEVLPVAHTAKLARQRAHNLFIHSDGVQAVGKLPFTFGELGVDALTISAHKLGGLQGAGALIVRTRRFGEPILRGGPQELRARAGTENLLGIASLDLACRKISRELSVRIAAMERNREIARGIILSQLPHCEIFCDDSPRLPNTLSVRIPGVRADDLVIALDLMGVAISSGAACASGKPLPSHVLLARGLDEASAQETVRISLRAEASESDVVEGMHRIVTGIRAATRGLNRGGESWREAR